MLYNDACGEKLSRLGFGCMRLPQTPEKTIDENALQQMVDYAIANGVNYFDTAWPYHGGVSELAVGRALAKHPRDQWFLASKYPGHQIASSYNPAEIFEQQLKKCGVEYFDFYLLHNVYENSIGVYMDPQWGILDYFKEQRRLGRIRHLGFSTHARPDTLEKFLDYAGDSMEFCQIQLNYLDWTLQDAQAKYDLLTRRGVPVWVMEPLRGGKLASLSEEHTARLRALRPDESTAAWSFRWLMNLPNVRVVLSGMSSFDQMADNVRTFSQGAPQTESEAALLEDIAESLKNALPCTRCRYCCDGCPMGLDIPMLIHAYNDLKFAGSMTVPMQMDALSEDKRPSACIGCGACAAICPQSIDIPAAMAELADMLAKMPSWAEMCRQREDAARRLKAQEEAKA
ncbi:MAG: aldo/keto reductase [Clostridia bacterium]|nr:aldo/keto reductase [Clostridia bacterium]